MWILVDSKVSNSNTAASDQTKLSDQQSFRYLIEHKADVAAVNNDGELPIDIAETEAMEELLEHETQTRGNS